MKNYQSLRKQAGSSSRTIRVIASKPKWVAVFLVAIATTCGNSASFAQEAVLEEIQVTARRRVEKDIDVPIAMTIMGEEFLRTQNISELTDLGTKVPGLQITSTATSPNIPIISVRGQRPNDLLISADQAVPIYFNDVVLTPAEGANMAMYDLQNVQLLKGPQGTLFGRNSTGGALLLTPTRPGNEFGGYLEVNAGNYELVSFEGAVDLPVSDVLQFRLAGRKLERDGYQKNVADNALNGKRYWDEDSKNVRLSMNLEPAEWFRNLLVVGYDENDAVGRAGVLEDFNGSAFLAKRFYNSIFNQSGKVDAKATHLSAKGDKHDIESDLLPTDEIEVKFASNTTEVDLNEAITFKSILGYRGVVFSQALDADGSAFPWVGAVTEPNKFETQHPAKITTDTDQYSVELQLLGDAFDGDLQWITGAYWFKMQATVGDVISQVVGEKPDYPADFNMLYKDPNEPGVQDNWGLVALLAGVAEHGLYTSGSNSDVLNEALGAFAESTYTFNPQWSTTLGVRYSLDDREITVRSFAGSGREPGIWPPAAGGFNCSISYEDLRDNVNNGTGNPPGDGLPDKLPNNACERTESDRWEKVTGRGSINFTPVDGLLLYGSISSGYRTGGYNMRGSSNQSLEPFDAETVTSYEIGNKTDWSSFASLPVRTNIALYYQDYKNIQQTQTFIASDGTSPAGGFDTRIANAGKATIYGLEFDITVAVTENLMLSLGYAYTKPEFEEFEMPVVKNPDSPPVAQPQNVTVIEGVDNSNAEFPFIPEHVVTATVTYLLPLDPELGDMSVMASAYWQDAVATAIDSDLYDLMAKQQLWAGVDLEITKSTTHVSDYALLNLRYDWQHVMQSKFDFALYVDNVTDKQYVVGGLNVMSSLGLNVNTYGPPRTYGMSLRYSF